MGDCGCCGCGVGGRLELGLEYECASWALHVIVL